MSEARSCVVCGSDLLSCREPPHCVDCYVSEEDRARWEDTMSEARSEYEWVTHDGVPLRVRSTKDGNVLEIGVGQGRWSPLTSNAMSVTTQNASVHALMDEIARLRGLVPPGGEEGKG